MKLLRQWQISVLLAMTMPLMGSDVTASEKKPGWFDKKAIVSIAGGAIFAMLTTLFFKMRSAVDMTTNTAIGVIKIKSITDSESYVNQIRAFGNNKLIKGLLVIIDSHGGLPGTAYAVYNELLKFKKHKPIVVLVENHCLSAAYYIASAADYIVAPAPALIGGIGVIFPHTYYTSNPEHIGIEGLGVIKSTIEEDSVYAGKFKNAWTKHQALAGEARDYVQDITDNMYQGFCKHVAIARGLSLDNQTEWAEGKVFTAIQVVSTKEKQNLVDVIGSFSDARHALVRMLQKRGIKLRGNLIFIRNKSSVMSLISDLTHGELAQHCADFCVEVATRAQEQQSKGLIS